MAEETLKQTRSSSRLSFSYSIVRIEGENAIGLGFLVDDMHIVTCAHVMKDVLNLNDYPPKAPSDTVTVYFPNASATKLTAHIDVWNPVISDEDRINDIAVLVLDNRRPETARPASLLRPLLRSEELIDDTFLAYGYPTEYYGRDALSHGKILGPQLNGRLFQILPEEEAPIEYGFSGTPVWDKERDGIVGMVVEAMPRKIAFAMPIDVLVDAWPDLEKIAWPESKEIIVPPEYVLNDKGVSLEIVRLYEEAIACYEEALKIDPRYTDAWYNEGNSLYSLKRYEEAIACYEEALKIDPHHVPSWNNKGLVLYDVGRYTEAVQLFDKALAIDPNLKEAWNNKGRPLDSLGRYEEAIACFDEALAIDPHDVLAWNNKGYSLRNLGRYEEAIACFDEALAIDPRYTDAWNNKGCSLHYLGRHEEAIACFDEALAIDSHDALAWNDKGVSLQKLGRHKEAESCFREGRVFWIQTLTQFGWDNLSCNSHGM